MATETIYGPQFWTAGDFDKSSASYQSTEAGGADAPLSGYSEVWGCEDVKTTAAAGPSGQKALTIAPDVTFLSAAGIALIPGRGGTLPSYQWDVRGAGEGVVIEWWQYFTNNTTEVSAPNLLALTHGGLGGAGNGLLGSAAWLQFEADITTGSTIEYYLTYQKVNAAGTLALAENLTSGVTDTLDDAWHYMQVVVKPSTVTGSFTGGGNLSGSTVAADGSIHVYVDATSGVPHSGTQLFAVTSEKFVVNKQAAPNPDLYYGKALFHGFTSMVGPVTGTWIYYVRPEETRRNLLTGLRHWVSGMDNLIAGRYGKLTGHRSVLFSLDGQAHTVEGSGKFWIFGDLIVNGTTFTGGGSGAPVGGSYVTLTTDGTLTAERVLTGSSRISVTDGGAGTTVTLDIPNDAINYARMQNVSAASRLLGRGSAGGAGDVEEISAGAGLSFSTTTLAVRLGASGRLLGRSTSGAGDVEEITLGAGLALSAGSLDVPNDAITFARIQDVSAASRILGRGSSGSGDVQELTLGAAMVMDGTTIRADGGEWSILTDGSDIVFDSNGDVVAVFTP